MKKTVWTFGLISGVILSIMMAATVPFNDGIGYERALLIGYTTMVLSFLLIFFGVRSYRDNVGGGKVGFGRAFAVGTLIAVIASVCYVATWEVIFYKFMPDYMDKYAARSIEQIKKSGAPPAVVEQRTAELKRQTELYKNPLVNIAMAFIEPLPVGLVVALVSAGVLSRRRRDALVGSLARPTTARTKTTAHQSAVTPLDKSSTPTRATASTESATTPIGSRDAPPGA